MGQRVAVPAMTPTDIEFQSNGTSVRGHLYLPAGEGPHPVVVMAGGWCYVKELVQPEYARVFASAGVAALVFDYRGFGTSDGQPRQHIDPWAQVEDYKNAITHVETRAELDSKRIGIWGISYSGGHVLIVGASDPRVRCIVSNIPVVDGWTTMKRVHSALAFRELERLIVEDPQTARERRARHHCDVDAGPGERALDLALPRGDAALPRVQEHRRSHP